MSYNQGVKDYLVSLPIQYQILPGGFMITEAVSDTRNMEFLPEHEW